MITALLSPLEGDTIELQVESIHRNNCLEIKWWCEAIFFELHEQQTSVAFVLHDSFAIIIMTVQDIFAQKASEVVAVCWRRPRLPSAQSAMRKMKSLIMPLLSE